MKKKVTVIEDLKIEDISIMPNGKFEMSFIILKSHEVEVDE